MPEIWDLYDADRKPLGRTHVRGMPLETGEYHLVVQVCVLDACGRLLLIRRHPAKKYGGLWEVTAGSVVAGEDSVSGAVREVKEETGLLFAKEQLERLYSRTGSDYLLDCFVIRLETDGDGLELVMQEGETTAYLWADEDAQEQMQADGLLVPDVLEARRFLK